VHVCCLLGGRVEDCERARGMSVNMFAYVYLLPGALRMRVSVSVHCTMYIVQYIAYIQLFTCFADLPARTHARAAHTHANL
jgi:hypothetical protein